MPSKTKMKNAAIAAKTAALPMIAQELVDQIVDADAPMMAGQINATTMALKKALIERALSGELSHHLGYKPGGERPEGAANLRNGASAKTVLTEDGPLHIEVPRDREGSFEPLLIPKHERRFTGLDDKIVAMYARGMTVREIQGCRGAGGKIKGVVSKLSRGFDPTVSASTTIAHRWDDNSVGCWRSSRDHNAALGVPLQCPKSGDRVVMSATSSAIARALVQTSCTGKPKSPRTDTTHGVAHEVATRWRS